MSRGLRAPAGAAKVGRGELSEPDQTSRRQIRREMDSLLAQIVAQRTAEPGNFSGREELYMAHHALRARLKRLDRV